LRTRRRALTYGLPFALLLGIFLLAKPPLSRR